PVFRTLLCGLFMLTCITAPTIAQTERREPPTGDVREIASETPDLADAPAQTAESGSADSSDVQDVVPKQTMNEFYESLKNLPVIDTSSGPVKIEDIHLAQVLLLALERNRTIIGSAQQVESADAQVLQARAISGARLTGNFQQSHVDDVAKTISGGKTIDLGKKDSQAAYVEVTQPLYLSGKDRSALRSARLGRSVAGAGLMLTRQSVLLETTMLWLSWLFAGEAERVGQKDLELAEAHHALVNARFRQKQVSQFEVLRADVRLAQACSDLRKKTNARELAFLDLLNVLDLPENTVLTTKDRLLMVDLEIDPVKDASEALELREDVRMKRLGVQLASQGIASARSENQPIVSMFGQSGVQDPSSKSSMGNYERKGYWKAGVVANFTLSDGGSRKGKIKEAHAKLAIAENALQEAIVKANIEIKQASLNIETAKEVVSAQREALKQAEEALRLAGVRYRNGLFTQVELFDAENAYLATRLQYLQAIFSYHQAYAAYRLATGKLGRELLARAPNK
ncbi:MAG TPA: TolC family protein, partial [Candidatus Ozemobacteraceae bacterium]|nr:TolC family protein [Candidatus Ozemobacteraceae bacterium]